MAEEGVKLFSSVITSLQILSVPNLKLTLFHNTKSDPGHFSGGPRASPHSLFPCRYPTGTMLPCELLLPAAPDTPM